MTVSLEKRTEAVRISLAKRNIHTAPVMRVCMAADVSGSAQPMYKNGVIQETVDRLLGVAGAFDDNGEMDMWSFTKGFDRLETAKVSDYGNYVQKHIMNNSGIHKWSGTEYAPPMQDILDFLFKAEKKHTGGFLGFGGKTETVAPFNANVPALVLFLTDGVNSDKAETRRVLEASQHFPVYWSMVGVGDPDEFTFIEEMADLFPNVGFVNMASLAVTDEKLYDDIVCDELCEWVAKHPA